MPLLKRILHPVLVLCALALIAEEWLWDKLKGTLKALAARLHLQRLEARARALPPWTSLATMALPAVVLLPFKMLALYALANGHPLLGALAFVGAKVAGTALAAYLFDLVRDNARKLAWFDSVYLFVMRLLAQAKSWLNSQAAVQKTRQSVAHLKGQLKTFLSQESQTASRWVTKWRAAKSLARKKL